MWQKLANLAGALYGQACHHIAQVGIRVVAIHSRWLDQAHDCCRPLAGAQAACEEPVVAVMRSCA